MEGDRRGAKQPRRFDPGRAALLDDPARLSYLPPQDVLALLDAPRDAMLVDFGTGTGTYALALAHLRQDLRIVAIDEQPEMLALVHAKLEREHVPNVEAAASDAIPRLRGRADRVLAINVLHELGDEAITELRGLLTPAGVALFIDWSADVERPVGPPADHVYTPGEAKTRLEASAFSALRESRFPYHYALVVQSRHRDPGAAS